MKIALLGSAPDSIGLAPVGNPSWKIWGCSPGVFYQCGNPSAWFELHRWEPPVIGVPGRQKQWFSPEYVQWMAQRDPQGCPVWMIDAVPQIPASRALPVDELVSKYGTYFFTSSLAWMLACAIEDIIEAKAKGQSTGEDEIGLWGVDMASNDEYGYQRAGCQHFLLIAADLGIKVTVPPESDLLRPMPLYGISEATHWMIKLTARRASHAQRIQAAQQQIEAGKHTLAFMQGAADELNYQMQTWGEDRTGMGMNPEIQAMMPKVRNIITAELMPPPPPPAPNVVQIEPAMKAKKKAGRKR